MRENLSITVNNYVNNFDLAQFNLPTKFFYL